MPDWGDILGAWSDAEVDDLDEISSGMIAVESSNLAAIKYKPNEFVLYVAFLDGSVYKYEGVPPEEYRGLLRADSHGEYFYDNIRLVYDREQIV